jgi:hypothetical protein
VPFLPVCVRRTINLISEDFLNHDFRAVGPKYCFLVRKPKLGFSALFRHQPRVREFQSALPNFETFWMKKSHFYKSKCKWCHQLLIFSWFCDVCGGDQDISAEVMVPQQFTACICNAIDGFNGLRTAIASFLVVLSS